MADVDGHEARREAAAATANDSSSEAQEQHLVSVGRLHAGLQQLLAAVSATNYDALQTHPALQVLATSFPTVGEHDHHSAARTQLQALASCLAHAELRVLIVKHLRPFLLDLMVRLTDPALLLYEQQQQQYSECIDSMKRSELLAATLAELLVYLPATSTLVQQYFETAPCFFAFADVVATQKQQSDETLDRLRRIAKTAFQLLRARPTELTALWNWTPFFPLSFHDDVHVRWYAARATALVLKMGNAQRNAFLDGLSVGEDAAVSGNSPAARQIELELHSEDATRQEQLIELSVYQQQGENEVAETQPVPFHDSLQNIFGVVVPTSKLHQQRHVSEESSMTTEPLVPTPSTKRNLQSIAIALGLKRPILVAGPGGCGKTATIRELARLSGNGDMVELHLDDQIDSKTLLGSYVCTDVPGEFTWQPGALTTAVLAGRWVVIEDIDRAPFEVLAALMPLLETREMVLPGRGELLVAHSNFQIFGTTTHGHQMPKGFQESVWTSVGVAPLADSEIEQIMLTRFTKIPQQVVAKIMTTYNAVSGNTSEEIGGPAQLWKETRRNYGRDFCLRDLLKWCKRIYRFCYYAAGSTSGISSSGHDYITEDERMRIVVEALDVFCAGIRDAKTRLHSACALAAIWEVQSEKIEYYLEQHKPHVTFNTREVEFGRVHLPTLSQQAQLEQGDKPATSSVVMTGHVLRLLEKMAAIVATCEPALLIGETGCGKTTIIQHMAAAMGQRLVVQNLNIQSDSSDLVGGFKPVEIHLLARPLYMDFVDLFTATFSQKSNAGFLNVVRIALEHKDWKKLVKGMRKAIQMATSKLQGNSGADRDVTESESGGINKMATAGTSTSVLVNRWDTFEAELVRFERQKEQAESHFAFSFVEGVLVKALREGHWVLLDEINLASSDTLERISTLLEHETSAFSLTERGDVEIIHPHPNFRLFGAMNPSTDVGKKDLPPSLRNRFTEIYVDECVDPSDLQMVVHHQFKEISGALVPETVEFYLEARKQAELRLSDGARHKPRYSLRTLSQALHITRILIQRGYGTSRAMFEGFCSSFCTQLEMESRQYLEKLIKNTFAKTIKAKDLKRSPPCPGGSKKTNEFVLVSSYWVKKGDFQDPRDDSLPDPVTSRRKFVLTKSVEENLRHVSRAALIGKYPVLLQGPTSAGKTSLIGYLAARIGQKCVRINNHEHTDIQEYLGSYVSDSNGKLTFKEGVLVEAVRKGWWIILDELNLAPSEVLEALNRLLDDNRELFLPETQETVKPHPKFMLFATQNPPGLYGGRKVLSRAFRNRFLEVQVDEVASSELQTILQERSSLPPSYCGILIDVMRQLQLVRQQSSVFAGKSGFITTRDLLRWAERRPATKQALAEEGYCLLAERLRKDEEKEVVKQVLEKKCNVKIDLDALYYSGKPRESNLLNENGEVEQETVWGTKEQFERVQAMVEQAVEEAATGKTSNGEPKSAGNAAGLEKISVTKSLRRLFALVGRCLQNEEPVLLVGETGCGKTTVCQLYSLLFSQPLHILNCHQHTETSDFLGCLRPVRGKEKTAHDLEEALVSFFAMGDGCIDEQEIEQRRAEAKSLGVSAMLTKYESVRGSVVNDDSAPQKELAEQIDALKRRFQSIFEWADGPLVESMKNGDLILIDEVNLAEDAVLERLNSVLEPSRTLLLAEKGGDQVEEIVAHSKWRVMATMNPGGDFGKRELSPALRNRFTEIWVPAISDLDDIATIIRDRLVGPCGIVPPPRVIPSAASGDLASLCDPILSFVKTFNEANGGVGGCGAVTLRDILSWINFITSVVKKQEVDSSVKVAAWTAFVQGAALSILDGLGLGSDKALHTALKAREEAYRYLLALVPDEDHLVKQKVIDSLNVTTLSVENSIDQLNSFASEEAAEGKFGVSPFLITRGPDPVRRKPAFSLKAPTTMSNLFRVLRAMQVSRPIILEGSPGVGKTSLISALAAASGHRLVRINLSEQTDISDLFGSDLPAASSPDESADANDGNKTKGGSSSGMFEWCDGVFLRALKAGDWVLLDELNLASQSVLEGLNSCLDHRGSVYIPELDREFECPPTFRVFAAQNPLRQGGGRKGLPKSFLNRFTRVFVETLHEQDLIHIASSMYPTLHCSGAEAAMSDSTLSGKTLLERMIGFNRAVHEDTMVSCKYGRLGAPWEFNLRDVFRFCDLLKQQAQLADSAEHQLQALSYYVTFIYVERMRSARDRELISRRFEEFFGVRPMDLSAVSLRMSADFVEIGSALLERRQDMPLGRVAPPVFNFLLKPMEALVHCVNMSWPALLVGPPASGKTSSVRLLAALSGNTLHELGMSAGTDATELLGCFEQVDVGRKLRDIKHKIQIVHAKVLQQLMLSSASVGITQKKRTAILKKANRLSSTWWALTTREKYYSDNASHGGSGKKHKAKTLPKGQLDEVVVDLMRDVVAMLQKTEKGETLSLLSDLSNEIDNVVKLSKSNSIASYFEWVDGTLIQAMEKGEWVLLDNVNFCSSSVLDRLNALMETGGEMLINECGIINGKLRVIKPHKNFRMFLAMDSQYGEVSRAMRNRCVEIALADEDAPRLDLIKISLACGIPGFALSRAFQCAHERVVNKLGEFMAASKYGRINRRHLENWSLLASAELSRGVQPMNAIAESFRRVYGDGLLAQLDLSQDVLELFLSAFQTSQQNSQGQRVLPMIAAPSTFVLCQQSESFVLQRDVAYLEHLVLSAQTSESSDADDLQLSWLTPNVTVVKNESPTEGDSNPDAWLNSVALRCKGEETSYPQTALKEACDHLSSKQFFGLEDVNTPLAVTLAPFALRRIVEVASTCGNVANIGPITADRLLFALDKIARGAVGNDSTLRSVELLARFLQSMTKNELYVGSSRKIDEAARRLTSLLGGPAGLPPTPVYLAANHAAFLRLQALVAECSANTPAKKVELDSAWDSMLIAQRQLELLDGVEWLRFCEQEQYREVDALFASSTKQKRNKRDSRRLDKLSVLQQSYAVHKYHADRSNVDNELTFLVHPLLNTFDVFLSAFVGGFSSATMDPMFFEAVQAVLRDRFEFSIQLRVQVFEWTHFLIHWQWLKKSLLRLAKLIEQHSFVWESHWNNLVDMSERMQGTIEKLIGCESRKNVLWKKGGHSLLPSNADLWKAEYLLNRLSRTFMQVSSTSFSALSIAAMKSGKLDVSSLFYVDVDTRKEVLHALCAFSYLAQEQTRGKTGSASTSKRPHALMAEELFKLPSVLLKNLQDKQSEMTELISKKTLYLSEIEDNADSHVDLLSEEDSRIGKDAPILLFDMKESALLMERMVTFQLSPLLEHALARQELQAITKLVHVLNMYRLCKSDLSQTRYSEIVAAVSDVLKLLEGIIEELLLLGLRDPACFYAYQDIVWCGHKFVSLEISSKTQDEQVAELEKFASVVQTHLNGVLFGFHQFLRCNSFNQVDLISLEIFDTRRKLRKANKRLPAVSTEVADHSQVVAGYPRLFQAVQSAVVLKSIAEVDLEESMCPTSEAQMRAARLEKIKSHFATEQTQAGKMMSSTSISFVRELFVATVLAFESTFQTDSASAQWEETQSLLLQFADTSQTFDGKTQATLLKALRTSSDSTFSTLVDALVAPLMTSLATAAKESNNGRRGSLGESMVMLGLWRFALLLPSSPVDPVTKPLVKKENLLNRLAMLTIQDAANSSINRLNPSPVSSVAAVENADRSLRELYGQVMEVSAHAIQRYQPSKRHTGGDAIDPSEFGMQPVAASVFGELFRDLLRFNTTVMPAEKLSALLSTVRSSKSSQQRKRELLRELDMFQQTSESFVAQLSKKFGECFRDILEPVAAAIYCVKEGVALVTWSLYQQIQEASLKEQHKQALALSLVQFPSSLNVNSVDQSWRGIQLMLKTVGTQATSILFGAGVSNKRKAEVALLDVALAKMEFLFRETLTTSRANRVLDSTAVDTALESSKTLFDLFLAKWQEQKEREEQKRKEEEELFKYKVRQLDLETEEELLEQEYRDQFPDYSTRDFQAFLSPEQASAADTEGAGLSATGDLDMLITDRIMQRLCETHVKLYAETANSEIAITKDEIVSTFARAFSLAVKLRKSLNVTASTSIESAVASLGVLAASLVQARLGSSVGSKKGAVPSFQALSSDYIRGVDFHRDPLVKEVVLVAEPLQRLLVKVHSLLAQWPDHAILQQIVLIADRIRNFEISSPLVRTLTGVELLLRKAQEWEMYAARAYSISDELGALSALVTRWRKLELYSWPHLLYVKEKQHRFTAQKTWINMYSLLTAQFESDTAMVDIDELNSANPQNLQWLHLNHLSKWLFTPLHENRAGIQALSEAARESLEKQREFMTRLFETLDAYIRSCPIGQYETRLLVVYSFCAQLFMELWSASERQGSSIDFAGKSSKYALANMLYHLYRYYAQHLGYLERQWSGLKAPIQRKLVEFVKICRWDEQTYYSLAESAEKSHRKLMKFVRDYDAVLTVSMQTVIDGSTDSGITKEGGFVGIHTTKAELAGLDDSVVVPKDVEHDEEKSEQDTSADGEAAEGVKTNSKKESKEEEAQESERPPVLRLIHTSAPSVVSHASEDTAMLEQSSYVGKLPALSKRIAKYTQKHILSHDQVERRQQVRELCEELCETIFYRMFKLQKATGLPKGAKKKALIDLLSELKTQGLAYHRLQLPAEQQQIQQLFELDVPDVENCLHVDQLEAALDPESLPTVRGLKGKKKQGKKKSKRVGGVQQVEVTEEASTKNSPMWLWQRADGYYYRFLGQLASLRYSAVTSFSHDLSSSETERMSGYAENMLFTMLQQRQILHATSLSHEKLVDGLTTLKLMKEFKKNYLASSKAVVDPKTASKWQSFQQASVVSLRHSLRELEISVLQILEQLPETTMIVAEVRQHFQRIFERCDAIQDSLTQGAGLTQSLGVPAIPHRAVNASEDAGGDAAIVAFARPSKRVYGVSPVVSRADGSEAQKLPVAVDVLKTNTARFGDIQGLLLSISSAFGTVTTSSCLEDFLTEFACIVRDDGKFEQTLNETSDDFASSADQKVDEHESAQALAVFSEQYDKMVETVLVSIQDLTKISKGAASVSTPSEEDETSEAQSLRDQLAMLSTMVKDSRVNHIASQLAKLLELLQTQYTKVASTRSEEWQRVFVASLSLLERFEPSLVDVRGISRQLLVDFLVAHKSVMKLDFVLIRIFRNLFQHGFCRTDEEKNGEEGEGNAGKMQFQDDVEGTGMGEGEGKKDVSNEIEDEEQLLGLQGDQQEEPEPPEDQKPEDTGLEMQNDFEGTMQDVPDDEKEDQDENEDDEEELDREMGEFDQDDENVVDEKMWGEDSDDDEDNIDKEKEKFEEDSKVEGEALEDEVRGKDGDEEDKEDKSDKKEEDKQKPQLDQSDDKNAEDGGDDGEDGDDGDDEKMEEEEVNDDFEDKYEDHHDVDPTEREEGHGEDEAEEEHGDELPEDMQLDKDGDDGEDDGDADGDNPDEDMDNLDDPEDEMDDANGDETGGTDEDENAEEENEEEQLDNAVQLGGGGLEDEPEQAEEKEEEDAEQTEAPESTEEEQAASTVAGTQSKDGQDELEADEQEAEDQEMEDANAQEQDQEQSNDDSSSSRAQKQSSSNDQDAKQEWKPQSQVDSNPDQERPREKRRDRREPNPYRNAQEAQEHWKKRVEMVDRTEEEKEADNNSSDKQEKAAEMTTAEFVDDDDDMEDVEHALAAADENQIMNQPRSEEEEDENVEKKEEDETNAGNGATAMEVDEEEEKTEQSTKDKEQDKPKPVKQEPKPDSDAAEDKAEKQEDQKMNEQDAKPENPTQSGEHELLDEEAEHALPSRQRDLDLTNSMQDQDEGDEAEARAVKLLSPDEVAALRDELDSFIASWSSQSEQERGADLWAKYTALTAGASQRLCEQLRLVLEPMLRAKLEGDFRTGKRINMRKVIPYIASQFRKDKIWLRRTRPSKRQYQVMLAIDDSESMADNHAGRLALEALATLCKGMTQLEVGELSVVKFGQDLELLHAFDTPFTDDAGSRLIGRFGFQQKKTNMVQTLDTILQLLETAKQSSAASSSTVEFTQIVFLISDGRFDSDGRVRIRKLIETALERQQLIVLLIVDQGAADSESAPNQQTSILDTQSVTFEKGKVHMVPYLENYPFPYYVLLPTSAMLPEILSDSLRQWFEMLQAKS
ncbi:Midasin [Phytophthora cactorum]|uniref:Midasin n=1 Tax=Phytophthora cactorum TaxID=29920 RepID=A0A8T0ZCV6_9STRA|nr:Midasin [Phytophthora cactorum]KAG2987036.1 Midasin [Phytophthora cactorum]KAG3025248.1 Midasin [Phytophthora cactorum]